MMHRTNREEVRSARRNFRRIGKAVLSSILVAVISFGMFPSTGLLAYDQSTSEVGVIGPTDPSEGTPATTLIDGSSKGVGQMDLTLPSLDQVQCASYFCFDRTTREVIISKNENKKIYPASMTKILTLALAMEYLDPFEKITVSKTAMDATTPNSTMMGLVTGEEIEVNEIYYGLMLPSGNDAANVLAEEIAKHYKSTKGTLPTTTPKPTQPPENGETTAGPTTEDPNTFSLIGQFAYIANMKIRDLGLTDSHFMNPNGLQNDNHYTTAHDLSMMFDYALNYKDFCTVIHAPTHFFKADNKHPFDGWKVVKNTNNLLTDPWIIGEDCHCAEVYGGKTGTTKVAGTGMTVLTINENGHEIITCVCGIPYDMSDHQTVYVAAVVREANLKCWEKDPVKRVEGNIMDYRAYNVPDGEGPTGEKSEITISGPEDPKATETAAPAETSETAPLATPTPEPEEDSGFLGGNPVLIIVVLTLAAIALVLVIFTAVSVARAKRRRKRMGVRKIKF